MSESTAGLRRQIANATELQSVVRTMRAIAASNIGQYEAAVAALVAYDDTMERGLGACLREDLGRRQTRPTPATGRNAALAAIVLGSDQGLVGPFNDVVAARAIATLQGLSKPQAVWVVGERIAARLIDAGIAVTRTYAVPVSVDAIDPLVGRLQIDVETHPGQLQTPRLLVFHNRPLPGALYEPVDRQLLPLDARWLDSMTRRPWTSVVVPELFGTGASTLRALLRDYLYVSLYRACAESLASENASRLAAMQRADKSIDDLLETLHGRLARLRQETIDAELFDVIAGYEAMRGSDARASVAPTGGAPGA